MSLQRYNFPLAVSGDDGSNFECWAVVTSDNNVFCKLKEFAILLGYVKVDKAYQLIDDRWKFTWNKLCNKLTLSGSQPPSNWHPETLFVSEAGIYALLARSNKPEAKKFMSFVYEKVLPSIRQKGEYISSDKKLNEISNILYDIVDLVKSNKNYCQNMIEQKPKLENVSLKKHYRFLMYHKAKTNQYRFIRTQHKYLKQALECVCSDEDLVIDRHTNATNIIQRVKEIMPIKSYTASNNIIITQLPLDQITHNLIEW